MRKFPRRIATEQQYQAVLKVRHRAQVEFDAFIRSWCPPEKADDLRQILHDLLYAHQQIVAWQSEFEVNDAEIEVH